MSISTHAPFTIENVPNPIPPPAKVIYPTVRDLRKHVSDNELMDKSPKQI